MGPIRVLYINGGIMDRGGISAYMMNYYRHLDRSKVQLDFVVHGFEKGIFDDEIHRLGGKVYNVPIKSKDYFGNIKALRKIFNSGKYKIVHSHMDAMSTVVLKEAKKCKVPIRIAHSHNTQHLTKNKLKFILNEYARKAITRYATHLFACSEPAGRWLFGNKNAEKGKIVYVKNAIDLDQYSFEQKSRIRIRKEFGIEESLVIGHVGRFDYQKNHFYLLEIFKKLIKVEPKAKLILIGDGHLKTKISEKIIDLSIDNSVILLGNRDDVSEIINAFDIFVLPSHFEGLGIVLVEAQANGLCCVASKSVPTEVNISGRVKFLSINNCEMDNWVKEILNNVNLDREFCRQNFFNSGYEIHKATKDLCNLYVNLVKDIGNK
jgi:glycosyltransferase involved in cell wall biosynthesis